MDDQMARKRAQELIKEAEAEQSTFFLWRSNGMFVSVYTRDELLMLWFANFLIVFLFTSNSNPLDGAQFAYSIYTINMDSILAIHYPFTAHPFTF